MHECGYTFNGAAPIRGLTQQEIDTLLLGHLLHNESPQARQHTTAGDATSQRQRIKANQEAATQQMIADLTADSDSETTHQW